MNNLFKLFPNPNSVQEKVQGPRTSLRYPPNIG